MKSCGSSKAFKPSVLALIIMCDKNQDTANNKILTFV